METDNRPVSFLRSRKLIRVIAFLLVLVLLLAGSSALIRSKGYEAYEYFDTAAALGAMLEIKERY